MKQSTVLLFILCLAAAPTCYGYHYTFDNQTPFFFTIKIDRNSGQPIFATIIAHKKVTLGDSAQSCVTSIVATPVKLSPQSFVNYNGQQVSTSNIKFVGNTTLGIPLSLTKKPLCGDLNIDINTATQRFHITPSFDIYYDASFELSLDNNL